MALAANLRQYTPPRHIQQMEDDLSELARFWDEGPWGWSLNTKQRYLHMGITENDLPTDKQLAEVRRLSSRQFGVEYYKRIEEFKYGKIEVIPCQARFITSFDQQTLLPIMGEVGRGVILKAPWSSSGRGNMIVDNRITNHVTAHRIERIIREQGGIVVEPFYANKELDFAMEFNVRDEGVEFMGYSVFSADETGHYSGNYVESQASLLRRIALPQSLLDSLIDYHKKELAQLPYRGPVGIDMMRMADGRIHPCVELNFRMTMGLLAILLYRKGIKDDQFLTPKREQGFTCTIQQGRLCILVSKGQNGQQLKA